jgi:spore germination cell wall hydrolase CwlJ-like protein
MPKMSPQVRSGLGRMTTFENYTSVLLALAIYREARGETDEAMLGVAWVIRNRWRDAKNRWPKTIPGVILQRLQFSSFNVNSTDAVFPTSSDDPAWLRCCAVVDSLAGSCDPTTGAQFYHSIPEGQDLPKWAEVYPQTVTIGAFKFYKQP